MDGKLNYVYAVYQEGSFTRAAEKLYISQPSLSAMVKKAEQALGAVIFDRGTNPLELTEAGRAYIQYIERVRQCEEELNEKLWDIQHLTKGRVRLGGSNYVLSGIVPLILERILPKYPGIEIELVEEKSFTLEKMLQAGELDLVIDSFTPGEGDAAQVYHHLLDEKILLAVPQGDPDNRTLEDCQLTRDMILRGESPARSLPGEALEGLLSKPFILLRRENDMYQRAETIFRRVQIQPQVRLELDQLFTSLQYTKAGLGCSFVTDTLFRYGSHHQGICLYPLGEGAGTVRELCVVHKKGKYLSYACRLLIDTARQVFGG